MTVDSVLELYVPSREDGWFYIKMMTDPATMAYNAPWFPPDGCIPDPEDEWDNLMNDWVDKEPVRFYAYLRRKSDGAFVGDVNYHGSRGGGFRDMGIVIYAPERGRGYGKKGLALLVDRALRIDGVPGLKNDFESTRDAAYRIHKAVGFKEVGKSDGIVRLELSRGEYLQAIENEGESDDRTC